MASRTLAFFNNASPSSLSPSSSSGSIRLSPIMPIPSPKELALPRTASAKAKGKGKENASPTEEPKRYLVIPSMFKPGPESPTPSPSKHKRRPAAMKVTTHPPALNLPDYVDPFHGPDSRWALYDPSKPRRYRPLSEDEPAQDFDFNSPPRKMTVPVNASPSVQELDYEAQWAQYMTMYSPIPGERPEVHTPIRETFLEDDITPTVDLARLKLNCPQLFQPKPSSLSIKIPSTRRQGSESPPSDYGSEESMVPVTSYTRSDRLMSRGGSSSRSFRRCQVLEKPNGELIMYGNPDSARSWKENLADVLYGADGEEVRSASVDLPRGREQWTQLKRASLPPNAFDRISRAN